MAGLLADNVGRVTIIPDPEKEKGGSCFSNFTFHETIEAKFIYWGFTVTALAGPMAFLHVAGYLSGGNISDLNMVNLVFSDRFTTVTRRFYLEAGLAGVAQVDQDPNLWGAVESLAERLIVEGTVSGAEVQDLLNKLVRNNSRKPEFINQAARMEKAFRATLYYDEQKCAALATSRAFRKSINAANFCFDQELKKMRDNSQPINGPLIDYFLKS